MARERVTHRCSDCGSTTAQWTGRCSHCGAWGTVEAATSSGATPSVPAAARSLASVDIEASIPSPLGVGELDRVLAGGVVPGSVTLMAGEPGIGKSTLALQAALSVAASGATVVYVSGEEAPEQVAARARRLGEIAPSLLVVDNTDVDAVAGLVGDLRPQVVVVDSLQSLSTTAVDGAAGGLTQLRACAGALVGAAKRHGASVLIIGHVTKDGAMAGPRVLEHVVDTVLSIEGDRSGTLRFCRALKHRFGPTSEVGLFEMASDGLVAVPDASARFLADRRAGAPGSVAVPVVEGKRSLVVELQALVTAPTAGPTRSVRSIDSGRLDLVSAVLGAHTSVPIGPQSLFASVAGGVKVADPGADLGLAVALASSIHDAGVPPEVVVFGELGLSGEVRGVPAAGQRLHEAFRCGFRTAIVPESTPDGPTGLRLIRVDSVAKALRWFLPAAAATAEID